LAKTEKKCIFATRKLYPKLLNIYPKPLNIFPKSLNMYAKPLDRDLNGLQKISARNENTDAVGEDNYS